MNRVTWLSQNHKWCFIESIRKKQSLMNVNFTSQKF